MFWSYNLSLMATVASLAMGEGGAASAQSPGPYFVDEHNVVIGGYDVVAYFEQNEAVKGASSHRYEHDGVRFHFSSAANRDAFAAAPEEYLPQYGGFCAYAMGAKNVKFEVDPETFKIVDGRLYLFYNGEQGNASVPWNQQERALRGKADRNWQEHKR